MMLSALAIATPGTSEAAMRFDTEHLDGPDTFYTGWLVDVLASWPTTRPHAGNGPALAITCVETPGDDRYVGMLQQMVVEAPLRVVEAILDDVSHYKDLFPGVVDVHVVPGSRHGPHYMTAWEQSPIVFFLPNVAYELSYLADKTPAGMRTWRYKLRDPGMLLASDGAVIMEAIDESHTRFTEYDFLNARWGPLPAEAIWRESVREAFLSDLAIKLRAENPGWAFERIATEAQRRVEVGLERLDQCYRQRRPAHELGAISR